SWQARILAEQSDDIPDAGTSLILVFVGRRDGESLAHILLMNTMKARGDAGAVIPLDDNRNLVFEMHDARIHDGQAERASELHAGLAGAWRFLFRRAIRWEERPHPRWH